MCDGGEKECVGEREQKWEDRGGSEGWGEKATTDQRGGLIYNWKI